MRPIDADELKKTFAEYGEKAKFTQGFCQKLIDNAPTVEPEMPIFSEIWYQERPKGEWIKTQGEWVTDTSYKICFKCSECGSDFEYTFNFCPKCGAKMEGKSWMGGEL